MQASAQTLSAQNSTPPVGSQVTQVQAQQPQTIQPQSSPNDKRDYRVIQLDNGMQILLISDQDAQRAAAAVDVAVGSGDEDDHYPGLAHFLEHMLFLGTDQYPEPDDYINFISDHGGGHNAYTAFDHTNYFFDIDPNYLQEGLKRFSRFFVKPLFTEKYVDRERHAVDSEYQSKLREDGWRNMTAFKAAINPRHPYARFSVGNNDTLTGEGLRPALLSFYQSHYSAEKMRGTILGKESLAVLEQWARELFATVPKSGQSSSPSNEKLFAGLKLPLLLKNQSLKTNRELELHFTFPYLREDDYQKTWSYLSYVLGYEGQGSVLSALKKADLASSLYAGAQPIGQEMDFSIGIELTEKGYQNIDQVLALIFATIDLMKNDQGAQARYAEIAKMAKLRFDYREKGDAMSEVSELANLLNRYPATDVLSLDAIYQGYPDKTLDRYLQGLNPTNMLLQLSAPEIDLGTTVQKTTYFAVPYQVTSFVPKALANKEQQILIREQALQLPAANPFIPEQLTLLKPDASLEKQPDQQGQQNIANKETYLKTDLQFAMPKTQVYALLQSKSLARESNNNLSLRDKSLLGLMGALLDDQLTEVLYDASLAGLEGGIQGGEKSLDIRVSGYSTKLPELLQTMMRALNSPAFLQSDFDVATFARIKTEQLEALKNTRQKMPYQQAMRHLNALALADSSLPEEHLPILPHLELADVREFHQRWKKTLAGKILFYGNIDGEGQQKMLQQLDQQLPQTTWDLAFENNASQVLKDRQEKTLSLPHTDSSVVQYYQAGRGYAERAKIGLLDKLIAPSFFSSLRTEKQLGYVVFSAPMPFYDQAGILFVVESPVASSEQLNQEISQFLVGFEKQLTDLSVEDFTHVKAILRQELLQQPKNLAEASNQYWRDIITTGSSINASEQIALALQPLSKTELLAFYRELINNPRQIRIATQPEVQSASSTPPVEATSTKTE